ncbi:MAG TPA: hypothetical protein VG713_00690 [Pirellulales bacterium]|nr:hypothetical protein [Pirellulales bacterium]
MKLRIRGNSVRLRLGRSDVARLLAERIVEESTRFDPAGSQRLSYAIEADTQTTEITASFAGSRLVIRIPAATVQAWGSSEQIGIEAEQSIGSGDALRILVEKDFECIDAPAFESQEDAYPHPLRETGCLPAAGVRDRSGA